MSDLLGVDRETGLGLTKTSSESSEVSWLSESAVLVLWCLIGVFIVNNSKTSLFLLGWVSGEWLILLPFLVGLVVLDLAGELNSRISS